MNVPIEWEQYAGLMFNGNTPDIIITPSDLMLFAKVSDKFYMISFFLLNRILKEQFVLIQEPYAKGQVLVHMQLSLLIHLSYQITKWTVTNSRIELQIESELTFKISDK